MITKVHPQEWDISVVKGATMVPLAFRVLYFDDLECSKYTPVWKLYRDLKKPAVETYSLTTGLVKDAASSLTVLDKEALPNRFRYYHVLEVTLTDAPFWKFFIATGEFRISLPGELIGGGEGLNTKELKIPVVIEGDVMYLIDDQGNKIKSSDGFIKLA